jgi:3-deoxy-D-manno-octulosonic-acid transferase
MYLLYSMLLVVWGILLIPVFLYKAWRHHKYLPGVSQRLGRLPQSLRFDGRPTLWFHSCSVGETLSLEPLATILQERFPQARLVFSTITKTGQLVASQRFAAYGEGNVFYFPVDLATVARRVLDWIRPTMMIIIDTEIWPNIVHQAHLRGIPVVLANGRISAASFRYYRWARPILGRVLRDYAILMMQSQDDALRIEKMGAPVEKIVVTGNIKFDRDLAIKAAGDSVERDLAESFGVGDKAGPLIVAGSTHSGEEQVLLEVLRRIRDLPETKGTRLLLAPRHPERFDEAARLAEQSGFKVRCRTGGSGSVAEAEVLLLDTVGELAAVYRFAAIVFVGGTLVRRGGHSIMEPALHSKPIVIGPSMENFGHILNEFRLHHGILQISAGEEDKALQVQQLMDVFLRLLHNLEEREALGRAAFSILEKNRGAARRTGDRIAAIFAESQTREPARASHP